MQGATHFLEIYKSGNNQELRMNPNFEKLGYYISPLSYYYSTLFNTLISENCETVAVWYIKPKKQC